MRASHVFIFAHVLNVHGAGVGTGGGVGGAGVGNAVGLPVEKSSGGWICASFTQRPRSHVLPTSIKQFS
jgi:hypothetical protein